MNEFKKRIESFIVVDNMVSKRAVLKIVEEMTKEFPLKLSQKYRIVEDVKPTSLKGGNYTCEKNGDKQVLTVNGEEGLKWYKKWLMESADEE